MRGTLRATLSLATRRARPQHYSHSPSYLPYNPLRAPAHPAWGASSFSSSRRPPSPSPRSKTFPGGITSFLDFGYVPYDEDIVLDPDSFDSSSSTREGFIGPSTYSDSEDFAERIAVNERLKQLDASQDWKGLLAFAVQNKDAFDSVNWSTAFHKLQNFNSRGSAKEEVRERVQDARYKSARS